MGDRTARDIGIPAVGAAAWCALFAALHVFWAAGGSTGLASSAGQRLADRRPVSFVIFGLYGVAVLLLAGIGLIMVVTGLLGTRRLTRFATVMVGAVAVVLLLRAVAVEILLAIDAGGLRAAIGPLQTRWSLLLWNPWFALGGVLFMWTAVRARPPRSV